MRLLPLLFSLPLLAAPATSLRFGLALPDGPGSGPWLSRLAASRAEYLVASEPSPELRRLAASRRIPLLHPAYPNLGQALPPTSLTADTLAAGAPAEARFPLSYGTPDHLIRLLAETASKGASLLLGISPQDDPAQLAVLDAWLSVNGESIFQTTPGPALDPSLFARSTLRGNTLYLHLLAWPANRTVSMRGLGARILSARLLGSTLPVTVSGGTLSLPASAPFSADSVVAVTLDHPPSLPPPSLSAGPDGSILAPVSACDFLAKPGLLARKDHAGGRTFLSSWTRAVDVPVWRLEIPAAGPYSIELTYQAGEESRGVLFTVTVRGSTMGMVKGIVEPTSGSFHSRLLSAIELEAGPAFLTVQPENKPGQPAMRLESVRLRPAK